MDMTPGSKHNDEHDEAQEKVFHGYGFRPGGIKKITGIQNLTNIIIITYIIMCLDYTL